MKQLICGFILVFSFSACKFNGDKKTLPIYGNRQAVTKTVNGQQVTDTAYQTIPAFKFVNQYNDSVGSKNLQKDIYVADFFFTSCPSICPVMQRNMLAVYSAFKDTADVKIISFTIDPKHDTVPVLKRYADKLGISGNSWWLLLGNKDDVYQLASSYLVQAAKNKDAPGGYMHDGYFILIDKQQHIRGSYDGTDPKKVEQLIADIKTLKAETQVK
jgi:protein SCO1/2